MNNNQVDIVTVGSLLNGKNHFYVPSYQRGYRWKRKQVEDLLSDLYSFRKQYDSGFREDIGDFYCLQPVIVREIKDELLRDEVLGAKAKEDDVKLWELVDGQQRMTSVYIILSCLLKRNRLDEEAFMEDYNSQLYTMFYESRPETKDVLKSLMSANPISENSIDATHILNVVHYIDDWLNGKGKEISWRYVGGDGEVPKHIRENLIYQIINKTDKGSTKVIWYQLSNDEDVDPVQEFTRINNGKIPLTDTELVKALFLQKKNFASGSKVLEQTKVSLQWEEMENSLQRNDFWCFISNKSVDEEDRMGELLKQVYLRTHDGANADIESGDIFRYFYNELEGLDSQHLQTRVSQLWTLIVDTYRTLEDWYETPEIYNYVGYLIQSGMSLSAIYQQNENQRGEHDVEERTIDDFIHLLEENIRAILPKNCVEEDDEGNYRITTEYPHRPELRKILLLLNVDLLSQQLRKIKTEDSDDEIISDANVFKFPYDLYKSQNWDIEHIDSATTNDLTDKDAQEAWVTNAIKDSGMQITDSIKGKMERGEWKDLIGLIQEHEEEDMENKNFIGNLTLLDSGTNREYKNDLFCQKRTKIIERVKNGRYILTCTQYVFMKFFDDANVTESRTKWTREDQKKYHQFILDQLERFIIPAKTISNN